VTADQEAEVARWLSGLERNVRLGVEVLARIVTSADARIEQAIKWGRLTFTVDGDWHHWLCGIAITKKATRLVVHKGALLDDPHALLQGSGRYLREIPLDRAREDSDGVRDIVRSAIDHQTDMLP
jgi:hypothetical protein